MLYVIKLDVCSDEKFTEAFTDIVLICRYSLENVTMMCE